MLTRKQIAALLAIVVLILPSSGEKENGIIYILLWTFTRNQTWMYRNLDNEEGQEPFVRRNCSFLNCYLTTNREYFKSVLDVDVLVFNNAHLTHGYNEKYMPLQRSENQLYVFFSVEPAAFFEIPQMFNGIFNLTWTYLLKSDIVHPYLFVKNNFSEIVAPTIDAQWVDFKDIPPTDPTIIQKLQRKSIAALWFVSNCYPKKRWIFAESLNNELSKYGHRVDTYGRCGNKHSCWKNPGEREGVLSNCYSQIESDYYFYLAFENSFTEDYISEKVLHGLLHFSVPIVYGGANYTRFLPDGIYLNALELGVEGLAREMNSIINNPRRYYDFFKWHNYNSVHDPGDDDYRETVCEFCAYLNKASRNKSQVYENITGWWNSPFPEIFPITSYPPVTITTLNTEDVTENPVGIIISNVFSNLLDYFFD